MGQLWPGEPPCEGETCGRIALVSGKSSLAVPFRWTRDTQVAFTHFIGFPNLLTGNFPHRTAFASPAGEVLIDCLIDYDETREPASHSRSVRASFGVSLHSLAYNLSASGTLELGAGWCEEFGLRLVDLLPAVTETDVAHW